MINLLENISRNTNGNFVKLFSKPRLAVIIISNHRKGERFYVLKVLDY